MTEQQTPYKLPLENDLIPRKAIYDKNKAFVAECDSIEIAESLIRAANFHKEAVEVINALLLWDKRENDTSLQSQNARMITMDLCRDVFDMAKAFKAKLKEAQDDVPYKSDSELAQEIDENIGHGIFEEAQDE